MRRVLSSGALLLALLAVACEAEEGGEPDAGADATIIVNADASPPPDVAVNFSLDAGADAAAAKKEPAR